MKIILTDGTELSPITVTGSKRQLQGAPRDILSFVFPADAGMETLDAAFTDANCESISVFEPVETPYTDENGNAATKIVENEYIHKGYTIRAELVKKSVEVTPATEETEAVYEDRITVAMAQRTYAESQIASLTETVDVLVMESLMA